MWWLLSFASAALLGCYDSFKKISLKDNAVIPVLFFNTLISTVLLLPLLIRTGFGSWEVQRWIVLKSAIVLCDALTTVVIPESVTEIGLCAFYECPNLTIHAPKGSKAEEYAKENNISFQAK